MDILSPFKDDWTESESKEFEGGEHAGRAASDNDHRFRVMDILIRCDFIFFEVLERLVGIDPVDDLHFAPCPGVNGAVRNAADRIRVLHFGLERFRGIDHVDDGIAAQMENLCRNFADVVKTRFASHGGGDFERLHENIVVFGLWGKISKVNGVYAIRSPPFWRQVPHLEESSPLQGSGSIQLWRSSPHCR